MYGTENQGAKRAEPPRETIGRAEADRKSSVVRAFEDLDRAVNTYGELLERLTQKLTPVLMSEMPTNPNELCVSRDCPFASAVGQANDRVAYMNSGLKTLIERIDL